MTSKIHISNYPPFGVLLQNRNFTSEGYRYGFNRQEKDNEIYGEGNSYTAEFWQYDSRLGRRWNLDPVDQVSVSNYACFRNNSLIYTDKNGDSVSVSFKDKSMQESFNAFFNTGVGRNYIAKYAAKGQVINGYIFNEDGIYHKKGIDINFSDIKQGEEGANAYTSKSTENARVKISVMLNSDINYKTGSTEAQNYKKIIDNNIKGAEYTKAKNLFIVSRAKSLIHESFIHAELFVQDYIDDGLFNYSVTNGEDHHNYVSKNSSYRLTSEGCYKPIWSNNVSKLFYYDGWRAAQVIHKWYKTGYSEKEMLERYWGGTGSPKIKK